MSEAAQILSAVQSLHNVVQKLRTDMTDLRAEVRNDIEGVRRELGDLRVDFGQVKKSVESCEKESGKTGRRIAYAVIVASVAWAAAKGWL